MNNIILFISGKAKSGKDTLCDFLEYESVRSMWNGSPLTITEYKEHRKKGTKFNNNNLIRCAFADEVKKEFVRLNPEVDFQRLMTDEAYKEQFRKGLIDIGDGYRQKDGDIWVNKLDLALTELTKTVQGKIIVIPDMRYINEDVYASNTRFNPAFEGDIVLRGRIHSDILTRYMRMSPEAILKYDKYGRWNASEIQLDDMEDWDFEIHNDVHVRQIRDPFESESYWENIFILFEEQVMKIWNIHQKLLSLVTK